jgi:hypothetical protein
LFGVGYYEAVEYKGVNGASMAGGCEIMMFGQGMAHSPTSISAIFKNELIGETSAGPPTPCKIILQPLIFDGLHTLQLIH